MTLKAFRRLSRAMLGTGAITVAMLVAACGSSTTSTTGNGGSTTTSSLLSCRVTASELSFPQGTPATATKASISGSTTLSIDGSTALAPLFQDAQASFDSVNGTKTTINPNGSGTGLKDVESGAVQIGLSDIFSSQSTSYASYADLTDHQVAVVPFTLVVSPDLATTIGNLTTQQVKDIYAGNTTNWKQIGGPDEPVNVVVRTKTSGTRATFDRYVISDIKQQNDQPATAQSADTTGQLVAAVNSTKGAIGYTGTSFVLNASQAGNIFPLCIDGVGGTTANINAGTYKFWSYEHAYTKGEPAATSAAGSLIAFVNSKPFQDNDLPKLGFLTVGSLTDAAKATHPAIQPGQ